MNEGESALYLNTLLTHDLALARRPLLLARLELVGQSFSFGDDLLEVLALQQIQNLATELLLLKIALLNSNLL